MATEPVGGTTRRRECCITAASILKKRWSLVLRQEEEAHRGIRAGGPELEEWVHESHVHKEVQTEGHIVRQ
jgi:hypothetical protein